MIARPLPRLKVKDNPIQRLRGTSLSLSFKLPSQRYANYERNEDRRMLPLSKAMSGGVQEIPNHTAALGMAVRFTLMLVRRRKSIACQVRIFSNGFLECAIDDTHRIATLTNI